MRRPSAIAPAAMIACAGLLLLTIAAVRWWPAFRDVDARAFARLSDDDDQGVVALVAGIADPLPFVLLGAGLTAVAAARGRRGSALAIVFLLAVAALATETLKLALGQGTLHAGAFPSGHTTAAFALAAALVIAAPQRMRPAAAVAGAVVATAVGMATIVLGWHSPSDVVSGVLVAGAVTGVVVAAARVSARR